jgi:hypothetical protein
LRAARLIFLRSILSVTAVVFAMCFRSSLDAEILPAERKATSAAKAGFFPARERHG